MSTISVAVHPDAEGVSRAVANRMAGAIVRTLADADVAHICITGGRGGHGALTALAADEGIDWHRVHVWWSDERFVPAGDDQRNDTMAREALLDVVDLPSANVHPMPTSDDFTDVGEGAQDDGSGCVMAMEAARMLVELGLVPRRTIRVVLYTNEENGLRGAKAYHAAHQHEAHVAAIEADAGCGAPWGLGITGVEEDVAELIVLAPLFAPLGAEHLHAGGGGADIGPLMRDGVMGVGLHPDVSRYFDIHHTNADTIEKIDPAHLQRNAAAMALMAYILAER